MSLIKRYIYNVGRRLPEKSRKDIEKELESLIMDALDARVAPGGEHTEEDVVAVLREFGPPQKVADRYAPTPQYLIGPRLFPIYRLVVSIVIGAVLLGLTISFFIGVLGKGSDGTHVMTYFGNFFGGIFSGVLSAVGSVTIVFAILERVLPDSDLDSIDLGKEEPWDPKKLPPTSGLGDWGSMSKIAVSLFFTLMLMAFFNLFPMIGIYVASGGGWILVPVIAPEALAAYLPMWNIVWVLTMVHYSILLVKREWRLSSRILDLVVAMANVAVLLVMATAVSLIDVQAILARLDLSVVEDLSKLVPLLDRGLRLGFIIAAIVVTVETAIKAYRLVMSERQQATL